MNLRIAVLKNEGERVQIIFFIGWLLLIPTLSSAWGEVGKTSLLSPTKNGSPSLVDTPEFIIFENKVPTGSKKITISGLIVDENENPIPGTTVLVRKGPKRIVEGGSNVNANGRFKIELAKASNADIQYYVEAHHLEHESISVPIKGNINSEIGIQLNKIQGTRDALGEELTPEQPFYRRFFKNLIRPYQKIRGVLQVN